MAVKELRVWFVLWLASLVVLVALPAEGRQSGPLYEGACEEGKPVLDRWEPALGAEFEPACRSGRLTLRPAGGGKEPLDLPADFAAWAFVRLNGQRVQNPYQDAYPYVTATGEPLIPLRLVTEAMGGTVRWAEGERAVTLTWRGRSTTLAIGSPEAVVAGRPVTLDQPPALWQDRTMVSPDLIARVFGAQVTWDSATNQLQLRRAGLLCSPDFCKKT